MSHRADNFDQRPDGQSPSYGGPSYGTLLRAVDANTNRSMEALRLLEDVARFVLDDAHLTGICKSLRHDLMSVTQPFSDQSLVMRDTAGDVGCAIQTEQEYQRAELVDLIRANSRRAQQAIRSLEECFKILAPMEAAFAEQFRYRSYTLESALVNTFESRRQLTTSLLYVLIDGCESMQAFSELVGILVGADVDVLQLRDKSLADRDLLERAQYLSKAVRTTKTLAIMNDRPDIAAAAHAHGVHVGQDELSVQQVRTIVGPDLLIGVSTHSIEQARQAIQGGANYIGVGPVFSSPTKEFEKYPGTDLLRQVAAETSHPAFAIGGINAQNLPQVLDTGCKRIAVSSTVTTAQDPAAAVRRLKEQLSVSETIEPLVTAD